MIDSIQNYPHEVQIEIIGMLNDSSSVVLILCKRSMCKKLSLMLTNI